MAASITATFPSRPAPVGGQASFPEKATDEAALVAVARFAFTDAAAYLAYRATVQRDPDGIAANARYGGNPPFLSYDRCFLGNFL